MHRIGILFGGPSSEYEISLLSAATVMRALEGKYRLYKIGVTRDNRFFLFSGDAEQVLNGSWDKNTACLTPLMPFRGGFMTESGERLLPDAVFPVMHGSFGEDGTVQAILSYMGLPFVGCKTAASAVAYDKILTKDILFAYDIPLLPYLAVGENDFPNACALLGLPFFLKPAAGGSSVGCGIVRSEADFHRLFSAARRESTRVLAETYILKGRELEVAVTEIGGELHLSPVGEIRPQDEFYSFTEKYESGTAEIIVPAAIPKELEDTARRAAKTVFRALGCRGLSRVDFFLDSENALWFNEINTLPGMTAGSLYPRLAALSLGTDEAEVFSRLIEDTLRDRGL